MDSPENGPAPVGRDSGREGPSAPEAVRVEGGRLVREDLLGLERRDLEALAADLGVAIGKRWNKAAIAEALTAVDLSAAGGDGGEFPDLGAEEPVV